MLFSYLNVSLSGLVCVWPGQVQEDRFSRDVADLLQVIDTGSGEQRQTVVPREVLYVK